MGKNEGRIVLQFAGVDTISAAELLAGQDVIVPFEERLPLDAESAYISDLIGCTVYDGPAAIGVVDDVQFPTTSDGNRRLDEAAPLLSVVSQDGDEILIPFAKAFLTAVDVEGKRIDMVLPAGLIEVNRSSEGASDQKR
jgi:16S rRNA processing protein RimM